MVNAYVLKGRATNDSLCISFAFGVQSDSEADLLSLKLISELKDSGYDVTGYADECHYFNHEDKWEREVFIRSGV
jgi:hypothetical protein